MENETTKFLNNLYPYFKMLDKINNVLTKVIRSNKIMILINMRNYFTILLLSY